MDCSHQNVRAIRKQKKMSLRQLADKSGLSVSFLSNYENGRVNITVAALHKVARAMEVSVKTLVDDASNASILVVPQNKRFQLVQSSGPAGDVIQEFLTRGAAFDMQVVAMHLPAHASNGELKAHEGEEMVYVLSGSVVQVYGDSQHTLNEGDFSYYNAEKPHGWRNETDQPASFLLVASRAGF